MITNEVCKKTEYEKKLSELSLEVLQSIINDFDFEEYKLKRDNYSNVFYLMNLRENTHSEILTWLFDIKEQDIKEKDLRYNFVKNFFEYIKIDINELSSIHVNSQVNFLHGRPDIVIETENYILVIEVKLDAKINISNEKTQLENYWDDLKDNKKTKKFIFIYPEEASLDDKKYSININNKNYSNKTGNEIIDLLVKCGKEYECIQFSDIVLILYRVLKEKRITKKQTNLEKNTITFNLMSELSKLLDRDTKNKECNIDKINKTLAKLKTSLCDEINEKKIESWDYKKPSKCNIKNFKNKLYDIYESKMGNNIIEQLLIQYVEYWLYCNTIIDGYTEIVEYEKSHFHFYIIDICYAIQNNDKLIGKIAKIKSLNTYKAKS